MDEPQPVGRRVLGGQRRRTERAARGGDPPELRTAHAAGGAERLDSRGLSSRADSCRQDFGVQCIYVVGADSACRSRTWSNGAQSWPGFVRLIRHVGACLLHLGTLRIAKSAKNGVYSRGSFYTLTVNPTPPAQPAGRKS